MAGMYKPLSVFAPGHYTLEIKVTDQISHHTVARSAGFEISTANPAP